ncbi:ABC transporter substrate-binding protein [Microbacterium oleivorans]|uniref:ABC transporter substrate-binding protein n=1 Tax=Microbacterium oleivorans TaxID=273677 RepID=A0A7D5JED9_9MICO|nr:ABC transporter substrate-binding protein [Microbacterium oleivorans]QLD12780.1 ABC transporter substrate-binding protein [Microbacterium oleivorans]
MSGIVLTATEIVRLDRATVFESFAAARGGWLFDAECDRLAVGEPISLIVPFARGTDPFRLYGRITQLSFPAEIVIEHAQPWRGRIRIRLTEQPTRATRIVLACDIDDAGIDWLTRRAGLPVPTSGGAGADRVGLLTSKTGAGAIFALAAENAATLAVEEVNADGQRPLELVVADDATDPLIAGIEAERLARAGCRAIVASVTSASFARVQEVAHRRGILAIHALLNEGGPPSSTSIRLGERPAQQIQAAVPSIMRATSATDWFVIGHTYSWSAAVFELARQMIPAAGGRIVAEAAVGLGHSDYDAVVERIVRSGAELVLTSLVGQDEVRYERAAYDAGLRDSTTTLSLVLDESTLERIGGQQSEGLWSAMGYFETLSTESNRMFVHRYRERFGRWAPPLSTMSEAVYSAILLLGGALHEEPDGSPASIIGALRRAHRHTPRGLLSFADEETYQQEIRLAAARDNRFVLSS